MNVPGHPQIIAFLSPVNGFSSKALNWLRVISTCIVSLLHVYTVWKEGRKEVFGSTSDKRPVKHVFEIL